MSTLVEIEAAADALPPPQQQELILHLARRLRASGGPLSEPRLFSEQQVKAWLDEDEEDMRQFRAGK